MTIVDAALRDSLRALKLSGMLHTLDAAWSKPRPGNSATWSFCKSSATTRSAAATR